MSTPFTTRLVTLALALATPALAAAQDPAAPSTRWEVRFPSGALIGTGAQRDQLKDAQASAVQVSWLVRPRLALTGTFIWARSRDLATASAPKLDVFTPDLGLEARTAQYLGNAPVSISGFAGLGAGARSYNYRKLNVAATHNVAGYAAVGAEARAGRVGLRVEARDYATGFKPLVGAGQAGTRNDVVIMAALTVEMRRGGQH
jgi:hypothetical protein